MEKRRKMSEITDGLINKIEILSKLQLNENERKQAKFDIKKMLDYIDVLSEVDTDNVVGVTHFNEEVNVFREDEIYEYEETDIIVDNAPEARERMFSVPKTL